MKRTKLFKTVCITCIFVLLAGCGSSPSKGSQQDPSGSASSPTPPGRITTDGTTSGGAQAGAADGINGYITTVKAKSIVLENAGLSEKNVRFVRLQLASGDGSAKYEIEFISDSAEYDYAIDAVTGEILFMNCEMGDYDLGKLTVDIAQIEPSQSGNFQTQQPQTGNSQGAGQQSGNSQTGSQSQQSGNSQIGSGQNGSIHSGADGQYIGREAAQQAALAHAGLDEGQVHFVHAHLEFDDGRWKYDVEFHKGDEEYDYDIDALTGEILSYDHDTQYVNSGASAAQGGERITQEDAKRLALAHAGVSESDAQRLEVEFDYDDGRAEYEVEWNVGRMEYSCDIDAYTGEILSFKKELD